MYPVTALPHPGGCSGTEVPTDRAAGIAGQGDPDLATKVSFGIVKVLAGNIEATGFVASESGLVVTHGLAVQGAPGPRVEMPDGDNFQGRLVGMDGKAGLAFLEVSTNRDLRPLAMGDSQKVCIGDAVTVVGFGGSGESESLVSVDGKVIAARDGHFRIDSLLSNSFLGAPLLNGAGEVIGVGGSGLLVKDGIAANAVSYVIPINMVKDYLADGHPEATAAAENPALLPTPTPHPPTPPPPSPTPVVPTATPVPTPLPTATPTIAPLPTATVTPEPTPTEPLPTATTAPTATPRATPRPRSTPRSERPVRATATPAVKATQVPTPTPPITASYRNSSIGYSIRYPAGWNPGPERNGELVVFAAPEGDAYIELTVEGFLPDWSLGEFTDNYRQTLGRQAQHWESFDQVSATGEYRDATNYVHLEFMRQREPDSCVEEVVTHLYRSRYFPARPKGYAVTMSVCLHSLEEYSGIRERVLSGFREFRTE